MCYFSTVVFNLAKYILIRKGFLTILFIPFLADKLIHVVEFAESLHFASVKNMDSYFLWKTLDHYIYYDM